ncbi:MAG TPA: hypothetical protein VMS56_11335 [Thermoanaerobaculia bacterium]|nr:hypothetical protein [Thermoanaerobaculia bacterium]
MPRSLLGAALLAAGCSGALPESPAISVRGRVALEIHPEPIVARRLGADDWQFPFEVVLRETGGVDVEIEAIRVEVRVGGFPLTRQIFDSEEVRRRGYPTIIEGGGVLQLAFAPVRRVADLRLLAFARAEITIEAVDRYGRRSEASRALRVEMEGR